MQIGRGPATVIGEPVFFRPKRSTTVLRHQDGKVEDPRRPESQEACPGALTQPNSSREGALGTIAASRFRFQRIGGLFRFARLITRTLSALEQ